MAVWKASMQSWMHGLPSARVPTAGDVVRSSVREHCGLEADIAKKAAPAIQAGTIYFVNVIAPILFAFG